MTGGGKCAESQVAAGLHQTHLTTFKLAMLRKVTPRSMQKSCFIGNSGRARKSFALMSARHNSRSLVQSKCFRRRLSNSLLPIELVIMRRARNGYNTDKSKVHFHLKTCSDSIRSATNRAQLAVAALRVRCALQKLSRLK